MRGGGATPLGPGRGYPPQGYGGRSGPPDRNFNRPGPPMISPEEQDFGSAYPVFPGHDRQTDFDQENQILDHSSLWMTMHARPWTANEVQDEDFYPKVIPNPKQVYPGPNIKAKMIITMMDMASPCHLNEMILAHPPEV
ncbi:hypothetical protein NUW58_g10848 [Xylaria curta]|uniref:Uncharacterized protein n=1 Tax=Xylaria curta TaxID=42375 RepID=A0ACC1MFX6_9PEZI|nr:hypothetical protein NUW58_g10848 [Xylaria curta]